MAICKKERGPGKPELSAPCSWNPVPRALRRECLLFHTDSLHCLSKLCTSSLAKEHLGQLRKVVENVTLSVSNTTSESVCVGLNFQGQLCFLNEFTHLLKAAQIIKTQKQKLEFNLKVRKAKQPSH